MWDKLVVASNKDISNINDTYRPLQDTMTLVQQASKGVHMNTLEQFYIQLYNHQNKLIPEQHAGDCNPLFQLVCDLRMKHTTT